MLTGKSSRVRSKANKRRLNKDTPLLAGAEQIHELAGRLEQLTCTVLPEAFGNLVLVGREEWRIQRTHWPGASERKEWDVFSVKDDVT